MSKSPEKSDEWMSIYEYEVRCRHQCLCEYEWAISTGVCQEWQVCASSLGTSGVHACASVSSWLPPMGLVWLSLSPQNQRLWVWPGGKEKLLRNVSIIDYILRLYFTSLWLFSLPICTFQSLPSFHPSPQPLPFGNHWSVLCTYDELLNSHPSSEPVSGYLLKCFIAFA